MPEITWRDISAYGRSDRDRTPHSYEARIGPFRIRVHRHIHYPGRWLWSVPGLVENEPLQAWDFEAGQREALLALCGTLQPAVSALQSAGVWPEGVERG